LDALSNEDIDEISKRSVLAFGLKGSLYYTNNSPYMVSLNLILRMQDENYGYFTCQLPVGSGQQFTAGYQQGATSFIYLTPDLNAGLGIGSAGWNSATAIMYPSSSSMVSLSCALFRNMLFSATTGYSSTQTLTILPTSTLSIHMTAK
jgi:hypothetical protein